MSGWLLSTINELRHGSDNPDMPKGLYNLTGNTRQIHMHMLIDAVDIPDSVKNSLRNEISERCATSSITDEWQRYMTERIWGIKTFYETADYRAEQQLLKQMREGRKARKVNAMKRRHIKVNK